MKTAALVMAIAATSLWACDITPGLLGAIAAVETGDNNNRVGTHGETTAWQITTTARQAVWNYRTASGDPKDYVRASWSRRRGDAYYVAADYILVLQHYYYRHKKQWPDLDAVLCMWNWGPRNCKRVNFNPSKMPACVRGYTQRVAAVMAGQN